MAMMVGADSNVVAMDVSELLPEIEEVRYSDIWLFGYSDIRIFGYLAIRIFGYLDI